jgi:hypothetical protein
MCLLIFYSSCRTALNTPAFKHILISYNSKKCGFSTFKLHPSHQPFNNTRFSEHAKIFFHLFKQLVESGAEYELLLDDFIFISSLFTLVLISPSLSFSRLFLAKKNTLCYEKAGMALLHIDGSKKSYLLITLSYEVFQFFSLANAYVCNKCVDLYDEIKK